MKLNKIIINLLKKNKILYTFSRFLYFRLPYILISKINLKKIPKLLKLYIKENDYFLYIGANNLSLEEDTFINYIIKYNLIGTCLEPNLEIFRTIKKNFSDNQNISFKNYGVGLKNERTKLYYWSQGDFHRQASVNKSYVLEKKKFLNPKKEIKLIEQEVELKNFCSILRDINHPVEIFIIDVESLDFIILDNIDLSYFNPKIIIYEEMHMTEVEKKR